jgi:hypothetical protein
MTTHALVRKVPHLVTEVAKARAGRPPPAPRDVAGRAWLHSR